MIDMDFSKLKVNERPLVEWMLFPLRLGQILKRYSNTNKTAFNIYISVPNSTMFSYFLFQGMFDVEAHRKIRDTKIISRFLELKPGAIVYFDDNGIWRRCSMISIEKNFTPNQDYHMQIQLNKQVKQFIPVSQWKDKLLITNIKFEEILNARVVKDFEKFSGVLSSLYSPKTIKALESLSTPTAYFSGNKTEFEKYINSILFNYDEIYFTHEDIIHFGSNSHFANAQWLTNKDNDLKIYANEWIISIGASKSLANLDARKNCGKIFIEDQFENAATSELLRDAIMQKIVLDNCNIISNNLLSLIEAEEVTIPNGVNIIAWK